MEVRRGSCCTLLLFSHGAQSILTPTTFTSPLTLLIFLTGVCFQGFSEEILPLVARIGPLLDDVQVLVLAFSGLGRVLVTMYVLVSTVALAPLDVAVVSGLWTPFLPI